MVLPLVLTVVSAATLLAYVVLERALRVDRISRRLLEQQAAHVAGQRALARAMQRWDQDGIRSNLPPGHSRPESSALAHGNLRWLRPHPLVALLTAADPLPMRELVSLRLPEWPLAWDPVVGLVALQDSLSWQARLLGVRDRLSIWRPSTDGTGPDAPWRAVVLPATERPLSLRHRGLIVVEGALPLVGDWEVTGLLILQGPVQLRGGHLVVRGGVVGDSVPSAWPAAVHVDPDRPSVEQALALMARPTRAPFHLRQSVP